MRWLVPEPGDTRTVRKFAWLPVLCSPEIGLAPYQRVWLERYYEDQTYQRVIRYTPTLHGNRSEVSDSWGLTKRWL